MRNEIKKFLIILLLSCFMLNVCVQLSAEGKEEQKKSTPVDPPAQLQLFQLSEYLSQFYFHLPPVFRVPGLTMKLKPPPRTRLLKFGWKPKKRMGRAIWQGVAHFVYATSSYWIRLEENREDWEYQFTWEDQKKRFLFIDGMRFDSNSFQFNWTHSMAGAMYYNYARANRFNAMSSLLYSTLASSFWEFVVEFREVVSINDMIATPLGGFSIGESMFQLGRFFRSKRGTFINKIARFLSNPILSMNDWFDRKKVKNQFAFEDDFWNDVKFSLGTRYDSLFPGDTNNYYTMDVTSDLILLPEYGVPETVERVVNKTIATEFDLGLAIGSEGVYEFSIFAKTVFFGYFSQNIRSTASPEQENLNRASSDSDDRVGYSLFFGLSSAFDLFKEIPGKVPVNENGPSSDDYLYKIDKLAVMNIIGPTVDLSVFYKDFKLRFSADAYGDFALVHSHAYRRYSELFEHGQIKSTLEEHGYYYAIGLTLASSLQLKYANLEFRGKMKYHTFESIEGLDRFQKDIEDEDDFDLDDRRFRYNLSLGYHIPRTDLQFVIGIEETDRKGFIGDFTRHSKEKRTYFQIQYKF